MTFLVRFPVQMTCIFSYICAKSAAFLGDLIYVTGLYKYGTQHKQGERSEPKPNPGLECLYVLWPSRFMEEKNEGG